MSQPNRTDNCHRASIQIAQCSKKNRRAPRIRVKSETVAGSFRQLVRIMLPMYESAHRGVHVLSPLQLFAVCFISRRSKEGANERK